MPDPTPSIHHICKKFFPIKGGVEVVVDTICRAAGESNLSTIITCDTNPEIQFDYPWATVIRLKSRGELLSHPLSFCIIGRVFESLREASVVYVHYPFPIVDMVIGVFGLFKRSHLIVYWHSNIVSQKFSRWFFFPFTFLMLVQASEVLVATPRAVKYSKLLRFFEKKIRVVPYCVDDNSAAHQVIDKGYFIAIGRHVTYKGFDVLIEAMVDNTEYLFIIGDGPLVDKHQALIASFGVADRVKLIRKATNEERDEMLSSCRALVLPSVYASEAFALVQLEAMKFGKPIINTDLDSGVPWVARNGVEAITVKPASSSDLALALSLMSSDNDLRQRLGANARKRYLARFKPEKFAAEISKINRQYL